MILVWLLIILLLGGLIAWAVGQRRPTWARCVALLALLLDLALGLYLWLQMPDQTVRVEPGTWLVQLQVPWIPQFGISLHLALDGLSLLLMLLTFLLGITAVVASWSEIQERIGFFHFNILWVLAGVLGVFLALDLLLFYVFWELMLVPMVFLIGIWGHDNRTYAAIKFFIFTQASGLLMLVAIVALVVVHHAQTGVFTFDYSRLLGTPLTGSTGRWLMMGFCVAFAVKLPAIPLHTWLPDAHTEAPTAGSIILAGLLLKTGAYGILRFAIPLFPEAARTFAPLAMTLGMLGILYGAVLAFAQRDLKRLVAYTSVSHLGFVLLGIFAWNRVALQGVVLQMICHGLSTGGLFVVAGVLQERLHTRDMQRMGGLWSSVPRMSGIALFLAMASLGLPGLGNFVAEFLTLVGAFRVRPLITSVATGGLVLATIYALRLVQRVFHGAASEPWQLADFSLREMAVMGVIIVSLLGLGCYPQPVLDTAGSALSRLQAVTKQSYASGRDALENRHEDRIRSLSMQTNFVAQRPHVSGRVSP